MNYLFLTFICLMFAGCLEGENNSSSLQVDTKKKSDEIKKQTQNNQLPSSQQEKSKSAIKKEKDKDKDKEEKEKEKDEKEKKEKEKKEKEEKEKKKKKEEEAPWFIGTYLALYGENVEPHKILWDPSVVFTHIPGIYDSHSHLIHDRTIHLQSFLLSVETGITKKIDLVIDTGCIFAETRLGSSFSWTDTQILFGFQIAKDKKRSWIPDLRVLIAETFPTGKYDRLNPLLKAADVTGAGAFVTSLYFVTQKTFYTCSKHPYKWNLNLGTSIYSAVHTEGLSIYGGGENVIGVAQPGESFLINLGYEYKFNKNWGWGIDIHYTYQNASSFRTLSGSSIFAGIPSSDQFSLAPMIEYDFSANFGVQGGLWYTLFGRNTFAFFSGFFALSYTF